MKTTLKNQDDIVFENRNKNYGAYFLRKSYNKNVTRALFFAVLFFMGIISIPLIANYLNPTKYLDKPEIIYDAGLIKPTEKPDLPKLQEQTVKEKIAVYKPPVVVLDPVEENIDMESLMEKTKNGDVTESVDDGSFGAGEIKEFKVIDQKVDEKPFPIVELMPSFFGGEEAMYKWLSETIKYPQQAKETGIKGTVYITFVVEKDGSITGAQLMRDIGGGCGEEALRVVNLMTKWREGRQNNKPVRVQFVLPIKFELE